MISTLRYGTPAQCMHVPARVRSVAEDGSFMLEVAEERLCSGCSGACLWKRSEDFVYGPFHCETVPARGEHVDVSLPASTLMAVGAVMHGLPWAGLLLGVLAGSWIFDTEAAVVFSAGMACAGGWIGAWLARQRLERSVMRHLQVSRSP